MEINGPPPITLTPRQLQATIDAWQVGQIMQARVVKQASPQAVILQVNNQQLLAETNVSLPAGQRLELIVAQLGEKPVLQARLLGNPPGAPPTTPQAGTTAATASAARSTAEVPPQAVTATGSPATARPQAAPQAAINTILKQALPKQASMANLLANIAQLNQPGRAALLPAPVETIVKRLFQQLPAADKVSNPQQLKQAITNSGVFLENKLNKGSDDKTANALKEVLKQTLQAAETKPEASRPSATGTDLKASLLRLLSAVQQTSRVTAPKGSPLQPDSAAQTKLLPLPFTPPPLRGQLPQPQAKTEATLQQLGSLQLQLLELGRQTEAAVARTHLHQAASMPGGDQTVNTWALELPLRNGQQVDLFDMVIEEETGGDREDQQDGHPWSITLAFDLDGLGPVYARLRLLNDKISTLFWAERPETTRLFNQHLNELMQRYRDNGLEPAELHCFQGPPPGSSGHNTPQIVLDVKA
jgi:hypothetical protein